MSYTGINNKGVLVFNRTPAQIASTGCTAVSGGLDASGSLSDSLANKAKQWAAQQPSPSSSCCCSFSYSYDPYEAVSNPDIPNPYIPLGPPHPTNPPPKVEYEDEELSPEGTNPPLDTGDDDDDDTDTGGGDTGGGGGPTNLVNPIEITGWFGSNVYLNLKNSGNNIAKVTAVSNPTSGTNSAFSDEGFFHTIPTTGASYGQGTYSVKFNDFTVGTSTYKINYLSNAEGVPYCCNVSTPRIKQVTNNGEVVLIEVASYCTEILSIISVTSTSPTSDGIWSVEDSNVAKTIKYTPTGTQAITTGVTARCVLDSAGHLCDITFLMYMAAGQATDTTVVANHDTATTNEGQAVTINVLSNDDSDASIFRIVSGPLHGSVNIVSGQIVYTPAAGFSGLDYFTYEVTDPQGNKDTATVSVTVTAASTGGGGGGSTGTTYCCNHSSPYTLSGANDNTPVIVNLNNYCNDLSNVNGVTSSTPASEGVWTVYGSTANSTIKFTPNNNTSAITSSVDVTLVKASDGAICTLPFTLTLTETNPNAGTSLCTPSSINVSYNTSTAIFTYLYDYYPSANGPILNSSFTTKTQNHGTWHIYAGTDYKIQYNPNQSNPGTDTCKVAVTFADSGDTCILDLSLTTVAVPSSYDNVCPLSYNISSTGTFLVDIVGQCSDITNLLSVGGPSEDVLFKKIGGNIEVTIKQMRSSGTSLIGEYLYRHTDGSERRGYITLSF